MSASFRLTQFVVMSSFYFVTYIFAAGL